MGFQVPAQNLKTIDGQSILGSGDIPILMPSLSENQIAEIENYLLDLPASYANPLLNLINKLKIEQNNNKIVEETTEEK